MGEGGVLGEKRGVRWGNKQERGVVMEGGVHSPDLLQQRRRWRIRRKNSGGRWSIRGKKRGTMGK